MPSYSLYGGGLHNFNIEYPAANLAPSLSVALGNRMIGSTPTTGHEFIFHKILWINSVWGARIKRTSISAPTSFPELFGLVC